MSAENPTMSDVLAAFDAGLGDEIEAKLASALSNRTVAEIAAMTPLALALELRKLVPEISKKDANPLALSMLEFIAKMLKPVIAEPALPAQPEAPQPAQPDATHAGLLAMADAIGKLVPAPQAKKLEEMNIDELYVGLTADNYAERWPYIQAYKDGKVDMAVVMTKTKAFAVMIEGEYSDRETIANVKRLARPGTRVPREPKDGKVFVTLKAALKVKDDEELPIYPFDGQVIDGPDEFGYSWDDVNATLLSALRWAVITNHEVVKTNGKRKITEWVFAEIQPVEIKDLLQDYDNAGAPKMVICAKPKSTSASSSYSGNVNAGVISQQLASQTPSLDTEAEKWCQQQLWDLAGYTTGMKYVNRNYTTIESVLDFPQIYMMGGKAIRGIRPGSKAGKIYVPYGKTFEGAPYEQHSWGDLLDIARDLVEREEKRQHAIQSRFDNELW